MARAIHFAAVLSLLATAAVANPCQAQDGPPANSAVAPLDSAPGDSSSAGPSAVEVSGGESDGRISIRYSSEVSGGNGQFTRWSLAVSTPTDGKPALTVLSMTSIPDDTAASFRFTQAFGGRSPIPDIEGDPVIAGICARMAAARLAKLGPTPLGMSRDCQSDDVKTYLGKEFRDFQWAIASAKPFILLGFEADVGYHNASYINTSTITQVSQTNEVWVIGASLTGYWARRGTLASVRVNYKQDYTDQTTGTACPAPGPPAVTCLTGALGAPTRNQALSATLELRQVFNVGEHRIAIGPSVVYDFENDVTGIDLPIYLVPNQDGVLNAGIHFGWRSDQDNITVGLFVKKSFGFF